VCTAVRPSQSGPPSVNSGDSVRLRSVLSGLNGRVAVVMLDDGPSAE